MTINTYAQNKLQETSVFEGQFTGKNLIVKNSFGPGGVGYCITETKVNGKVTKDEINANLFQIDLGAAGLKEGEKVKIEISYLKGCSPLAKPLLINPAAITNNSELTVEGKYSWQNLFVVNPQVSKGEGYSIKEVLVNGKPISTKIDSDIFEIKLQAMNFKENEKIKIEFKYTKGFDPVLLNPEVIN